MISPNEAIVDNRAAFKAYVNQEEAGIDVQLKSKYFGNPVEIPVPNNLLYMFNINRELAIEVINEVYPDWHVTARDNASTLSEEPVHYLLFTAVPKTSESQERHFGANFQESDLSKRPYD